MGSGNLPEGSKFLGLCVNHGGPQRLFFPLLHCFLLVEEKPSAQADVTCTDLCGPPWSWWSLCTGEAGSSLRESGWERAADTFVLCR